jgi:cyclic pyranopterin phosphate synthase
VGIHFFDTVHMHMASRVRGNVTALESCAEADALGRPLGQLRISVTDRCNFRCTYCMPKAVFGANHRFLPRAEVLSFEEIERLARILSGLGVEKVRLTGGEPTLRRDLPQLVRRLAGITGLREINLTTNGSRLVPLARPLKSAGLTRVTVSLDSLDDNTFRAMNEVDFPVGRVLDGIEAVRGAGFDNVKVNTVVKRGVNDHGIVDIARQFRGTGITIRFIEFMDVGLSNGWRMKDVVPAEEILARIGGEFPVEPLSDQYRGQVAERFRYLDGGGEIGIIASVTRPFCGDCSRLRLSADGRLYTCLFGAVSHDLRSLIRGRATDSEIERRIQTIWGQRTDRYSERRQEETISVASDKRAEMSYIGG